MADNKQHVADVVTEETEHVTDLSLAKRTCYRPGDDDDTEYVTDLVLSLIHI